LEADLAVKGYASTRAAARRVLETLILKLSRQAQPQAAETAGTRR
jgi:hypothetical protein